MKKRILLGVLMLAAGSGTMMAQTADRESLGFHTVPGYPYCPIDTAAESWSLVTEHIVPLQSSTSFMRTSMNTLGVSYRTFVSSPDGADIVVAINDYFEKSTPVKIEDLSAKRPAPRKRSTQSNQQTVLKIGKFSITTGSSKTVEPTTPPPPPGPHALVALSTKEVGFTVEVSSQSGVVYTDTLYYLQDFVSNPFLDKKLAEDDLHKKMSGFTLANQLKDYSPFLSKVIGSTPLSTVKFHLYKVRVRKKCTIDYTDINTSVDKFQEAFDFLKKRPFELDRFKEMAAPSVKVWQEALAQSNPNDENAKVNKEITAAMYYNMAVYSALCKDFAGSESYYKKADEVLFDFGDASRMAKLVKTWAVAQENYKKSLAE
ncbi:MAG: hypothetical protein K6F48_11235 [Paludibacteraceae bacterium]|nr:hypothetical protein [Paludibacteraceae bacterium]